MSDPLRHAFAFCPRCRTPMDTTDEGGVVRPVCSGCGFVQYLNPSPAAATVIRRGNLVCLVQRKFAPKAGEWTLPAGFIEYDEAPDEAARRETREETGLDVRIDGLLAVHQGVLPPDRPVILIVYAATELGGELQAGDDAAAVGFWPPDAPPGPIAFSSHRRVLAALVAADREARR
ncbi:MAG: NUDIX hydrolase [bacterium]|nr:NUDIX hydrolase [bacterium]